MHACNRGFPFNCFRIRRARRAIRLLFLLIAFLAAVIYYNHIGHHRDDDLEDLSSNVGNYVPACGEERINFVYIKMIKCASTTLSGVFRRFGLLRNLSFVLPPKGKIYIGWPYQIDETFYR